MANHFEFRLNTNVIFGADGLQALIPFLKQNGYRNISVIIDSNVERSDYWQQFKEKLAQGCSIEQYFKNDMMEPTYDYLDEIRVNFNCRVDCLIGVGGGSTMDIAKAISVLVTNKQPAIKFRGHGLIRKSGIPLVLVPTTAGTGSEVTPFAVFIDTREKRKFGINSPLYLPALTIIDPVLTLSCPRSVTVASGMDALTHTLESFVAKKHTDISRFFSREAFRLLYNNLPRVVEEPGNIKLRSRVSLGAYYGGIALFNAAAGLAGVLSYPVGTLFNVTHGLAGSVFLYPVVEFNVRHGYREYEELYDLIEPDNRVESGGLSKSELFLKSFYNLCEGLRIPKDLGTFGVTRNDIPEILRHLQPLWAAVEQNPVAMNENDICDILSKMLDR